MTKIKTMKVGQADYAKVADRLKIFREENPRGSIETQGEIKDGVIIFRTTIIKDLSDAHSARATGTALQEVSKKTKEFEKTESISVGRALALLGYLASGEIASSEEMEEFQSYKEQQRLQAIEELKSKVDEIKDKNSLREFYRLNRGYGVELDEYITNKSKQLA